MPAQRRGRSATPNRRARPTRRAASSSATPVPSSASTPARPIVPPSQNADTSLEDMSSEVLQLMLAQNHLPLTGSRREMLNRLQVHNATPSEPTATPLPNQNTILTPTMQSSPPSSLDLDDLVDKLVPVLIQRLAQAQTQTPCSQADVPPPHQSSNVLGNPSHVSQLLESLSTVPAIDTLGHNPADLPTTSSQQPLATHLPRKLTQSILNGEYVDFASLLPENVDLHPHSSFSIAFDGSSVTIPLPTQTLKIDSLDKWLTAFSIYSSVVVSRFPLKASQLLSYQQIIRSAARKFRGLAWYSYDVDFRRKAAKKPFLNWGERDLQLYLDKFTGLARTACFSCGSADHLAESCPLSHPRSHSNSTSRSEQLCANFNRGKPCATQPCPFQHRCTNCGEFHSEYDTHGRRSTEEQSHKRRGK